MCVCTCLAGYARDMHNICRVCENGTFCAGGDLPAQMCPANSNSHVGATKISDCLCDFTGDDGGPCTACTVGKYKTSIGSGTCSHCLLHSTTLATASFSALQCVCNAGFELINGMCKRCAVGHSSGKNSDFFHTLGRTGKESSN
jgi:hypothetical protein